jgi:O-antigen ligase
VLTFARGAFISIPLSIAILILFLPSRKTKTTLLACMAGLTIGILIAMWLGDIPIFSRFLNQDVTTFDGRTLLWKALFDHLDPKELLGNGLAASKLLLATLPVGQIATAPSNLFLEALYDHGIIGLGLLLAMLVALLISIIKGILRTKGEQRMLFGVALAILVSVLLQSLEQDDFWVQTIGIYFWVIMTIPFSQCWEKAEKALDEDDDSGNEITAIRIETPWWIQKRHPVPVGGDKLQPLRLE